MADFFDSSLQLKAMRRGGNGFTLKYPWRDVPVGKSFTIADKNSIKLTSLRTLAFRTGQRLGKKFRVIEHRDCYEVGCVAIESSLKPSNAPSEQPAAQPSYVSHTPSSASNEPSQEELIKRWNERTRKVKNIDDYTDDWAKALEEMKKGK